MANSKLPLAIWFEAMWLMTIGRSGFSSSFLAAYFGIDKGSSLRLLRRLRIHMANINDNDWRVQRHETYTIDKITVKKIARGPGVDNNPIRLLGIRSGGQTFTKVIEGNSSLQGPRIIRLSVPRGSTLRLRNRFRYWKLEQSSYKVEYIADPGVWGKAEYNLMSPYWMNLRKQLLGIPAYVNLDYVELYAREYEFRDRLRRYPKEMLKKLLNEHPRAEHERQATERYPACQ